MTNRPAPPAEDAPRTRTLEWALAALEGVLLLMLGLRVLLPGFLAGELLPCAVLALAPGALARLAGARAWPLYRVGVAAGLILFLFTNSEVDLAPLARIEVAWPPAVLGWALLLPVVPAAGALRWRRLLAAHGIDLPLGATLRLVLVGHFFNTFVPGAVGGDLVRAYAVARDRRRPDAAVTTVILDRFLGLPMLLVLLVAGCALNLGWLSGSALLAPYVGGFLFLVIVTLGLLALLFAGGAPARRDGTSTGGTSDESGTHVPSGGRGRLARAVRAVRRDRAANAEAMLWSLPAHAAMVAAGILFARAVGSDIPVERLLLLVPLGLAVNAVPVAPGGVGQGEGAFYALFAAASAAEGAGARGLVVMLGLRAGLLAFALVGGVLYATGRDGVRPDDAPAGSPAPAFPLDTAAAPTKDPA